MTPFADYFGTKLQVTIAGGELPDLFFIIADPGITLVPEFFNAKVADLTPHLSGDAVKDYPNLAAIPTRASRGSARPVARTGRRTGTGSPVRECAVGRQ